MMMPTPSVAQPPPSAVVLLESMVEELRCPLCFEVFHEPRTLGCMHTFCADCLASLVIPTFSPNKPGALSRTEYLKFIECPLCRRSQELGPEGVDGLPRHHAIANLAQKYRATMAAGSTDSSLDALRSQTPSPMPMLRPQSPAAENYPEGEEGAQPREGDDPEAPREAILPPLKAVPPTVQRIMVNHLRFRLRSDEASGLVRTWLQSLSWVPAEFHRDVVIGDFTRHFIPFYQFDVHTSTEVAWHSTFVFTDMLSSQQQLTVKYKHTVFALASAENLHSPHVEALVKFKDKTRHLVLSKVPIDIPRDAETVWQEKGKKLAVAAADKHAESKIPAPYALCRNENETCVTSVESYQPRVVAYPLYYGYYVYRDRKYRVVVDGFTKEVAGEKPFGLRNRKWAGIFPTFE